MRVVACLLLAASSIAIESNAAAAAAESASEVASHPPPKREGDVEGAAFGSQDDDSSGSTSIYRRLLRRLFLKGKADSGKLKLRWGPNGKGIGQTIDVYEPPHHDDMMVQQQQNKKNVKVADAIAEAASPNNDGGDVDPVLVYCTHVAMCHDLTAYVDDLTTQMEDLVTYAGMIDECRNVNDESDPVTREFCSDARDTWERDAAPLLRRKVYVETMTRPICDLTMDAAGPLRVTDETCADDTVVSRECLDGLTLCSDGRVSCSDMPYSCPKNDDCSTFCAEDGAGPCVCVPAGSTGSGSGSVVDVMTLPPPPREGGAGTTKPDAPGEVTEVAEKEVKPEELQGNQEEELQEEVVEVAEEVEGIVEELTAVELEMKTAKEIEELKAKIAELESVEAKGNGDGRGKRNLRSS